jgi:hypothetical protein
MINKWVLGGRFLESEFKGELGGGPFEGIGLTGYDNSKQRYVGTWIDSMGTAILPVSEGTWDASTKTITSTRMVQSMLGAPMQERDVTKIVSNNEHIFEVYATIAGKPEVKTLEIHYTRM